MAVNQSRTDRINRAGAIKAGRVTKEVSVEYILIHHSLDIFNAIAGQSGNDRVELILRPPLFERLGLKERQDLACWHLKHVHSWRAILSRFGTARVATTTSVTLHLDDIASFVG